MGEIKTWLRDRFRSVGCLGVFQILSDSHNVVLMYHSVGGQGYANISKDQFRNHIQWINKNYNIVDLPAVLEPGNSKRIALTFDDGYRSFANAVVPILKEFSIPATVFIIGKTLKNNSFVHAGPPERRTYMTTTQLRNLADSDLVTIGNHTMTHPNLPDVSSEERLQTEIGEAKDFIEDQVGCQVNRFCYPYGNWSEHSREIIKQEHKYAVEGCPLDQFISSNTDSFTIPRRDAAVSLSTLRYDISDTATYLSQKT